MSTLQKEDMQELMDHIDDVCVSLFMPTHPVSLEPQRAEPVLLKNLIVEARKAIGRQAPFMRQPDIEKILRPASNILQRSSEFWKHQESSLAIFMGTDFKREYQLPLVLKPQVRVSSRFYIRPLLPLLTEGGRFYLLAFSQNQVRLFRATQRDIEEIALQGIPTNLDEVLALDDPEKELQFRGGAGGPGGAGKRSTIFYSVDVPGNYKKESLVRYCKLIDAGLKNYLRHETVPLVLACVDYLFAIYRQTNSYHHLIPECLSGSPDRLSINVLHQKGWEVVQPTFRHGRQEALAHFRALVDREQALTDVEHIVAAAFQGRVETLFTAADEQQWGFFNQLTGQVHLLEQSTPSSQELLNLAAVFTLTNGGKVFVVEAEELPQKFKAAAVLRF